MPKTRKRKAPITSTNVSETSSSNPYSSRTLIRNFHVLLKRQTRLQGQKSNAQTSAALADVQRQIETLGGLSAYQRMSSIGQGNDRGGGSEKVFIAWLKGMGVADRTGKPKLTLLEVGALKPDNYSSCSSWIQPTLIDLRSRDPSILEQDFLTMDEAEHAGAWDAISLSLVVNFVPNTKDRGRMLRLAHVLLSTNGLLFLALPLPCVSNSRYFTFDHLKSLMASIGFEEVEEKWKHGGKMAYWLYRRVDRARNADVGPFQKKTVFRQGNRNNFVILL